jgi:hypothetical protein
MGKINKECLPGLQILSVTVTVTVTVTVIVTVIVTDIYGKNKQGK